MTYTPKITRDTMLNHDIRFVPEQDISLPFKYSITSYGADYDVDGIVKRINRNDIKIPEFQRSFVWTLQQASKFIETLLLGLPVPGVFLSKEKNSNKLIVIDGQQRLKTLQFFYNGIFERTGKEFQLTGINPKSRFNNLTYKSLRIEDKRMLDDSIIHATIIKQDEPDDGDSSIYFIFERLNTGGTQLQPQEIRTAIYYGEFSRVLNFLNKNLFWRDLYGKTSPRKRDVELILRFLALFFDYDKYEKPMQSFLNNFMGANRDLKLYDEETIGNAFFRTIEIIHEQFGSKAFKPKGALNAAILDSLLVGVATRLRDGAITNSHSLQKAYYELLDNDEYRQATETATTDEENVQKRLMIAIHAFKNVP